MRHLMADEGVLGKESHKNPFTILNLINMREWFDVK